MITLPKNWKTYVQNIRERSKLLIDFGFWEGVDHTQLSKWFKNFNSDEEEYLGACIIDSLIFRSKKQTHALIFQQLSKSIPNLLRKLKSNIDYQNFLEIITQDQVETNFRFVVCSEPGDTGLKSSNEILRFMKREFKVNAKWIINPAELKYALNKGVKTLIFIDDFLGTGLQFIDIHRKWKLNELAGDINVIFAPLTAHHNGIQAINEYNPSIKIIYSEKLELSNSFFEAFFNDEDNKPPRARMFYTHILDNKNIYYAEDSVFGVGNLELTYAFDHACPDNTLPMIHYEEINKWSKLLNR